MREQEMLNEMTVAAITAGPDVQGFASAPTLGGIFLASPATGGSNAYYYYKYYNAVAESLVAGPPALG